MLIAIADFCKLGSQKITGSVTFTQYNPKFVRVDISLKNVPIGIHGIHIHEYPVNFRSKEDFCSQAKGHFNAYMPLWSEKNHNGIPHGSYMFNTERHVGDMCNNIFSMDGTVKMTYIDHLITLVPGEPNCVVGRSIVIHEDGDDEGMYGSMSKKDTKKEKELKIKSKITGNAGNRIACANIILLNA